MSQMFDMHARGLATVAGTVVRSDWMAPVFRDCSLREPPVELAKQLESAWLLDARMEHASVASFARFTLELMSVGAPVELVMASQQAGLDEIAHARRCFSLASRFGGRNHGPGALDLTNTPVGSSLAEIVVSAIRDGCIGETLAALTARAQLDLVRDPEVRDAVAIIARDEALHAELAWRFVAWAMDRDDPEVHLAVMTTFESQLRQIDTKWVHDAPPVDPVAWSAFGRLTTSEHAEVIRAAYKTVLLPCAQALLHAQLRTVTVWGFPSPVVIRDRARNNAVTVTHPALGM